MKGKDILIGLGYVDEQFIDEAENKKPTKKGKLLKFAMPIAASFAVVIFSLALYLNGGNTPPVSPNSDTLPPAISGDTDVIKPSTNYKLKFNNASMVSGSKIAINGHFWHELDTDQAVKVLPIISQKHKVEGTVHYSSADGKAALYEISTSVIVDENIGGKITIAPNEIINDYIIDGDPILSEMEGIHIEAGLFITDKNSKGEQNYIYYADFKMDGIDYYMEFASKNQEAEDVFTGLVAEVILGGKADLSIFDNPAIPNIIEKNLTESEAYSETDFGKYIIKIPNDYLFNGANRLLNQNRDLLSISWSKGYNDVTIQASKLDEDSQERIVSPQNTELYDMSLYSIPWADSMPRDTSYIIENPLFKIEDLTLDMIKMRGYTRGEAGNPSGNSLNMRFSVLYGDIVVEVNSEGLSAEYLFDELTSLILE